MRSPVQLVLAVFAILEISECLASPPPAGVYNHLRQKSQFILLFNDAFLCKGGFVQQGRLISREGPVVIME